MFVNKAGNRVARVHWFAVLHSTLQLIVIELASLELEPENKQLKLRKQTSNKQRSKEGQQGRQSLLGL